MKKTLGRALAEEMADEQRRVVADWHALVLLRRATRRLAPEERRWSDAPSSVEETRAIMRRLVNNGEFAGLKKLPFVYEVRAPFAHVGGLSEDELLMEVHPYAALSHVTALVFHGMTDDYPQELHAILPTTGHEDVLPPGTLPEDWEGMLHAHGRMVSEIQGKPVHWHGLAKGSSLLGTAEYRPRGYPVRVTTPERTLLDGLMHPEWCGGFDKVLRAWGRSRDTLDLEALVFLVESMDIGILRQRTGFLLERLGLEHSRVAQWPAGAKRGGSSRLVGAEPFRSTFSERWKLSLNASVDAIDE